MNAQKTREHSLKRLKSIPKSFIGYFKNSDSAIIKAKQDRNYFLAVFWFAVFALSAFVLTLGFLYSAEKDLTAQYTKANLLKNVKLFNPAAAFVLGFLTAAVLAFIYILIRFSCVKIFTRKTKAKTVLADSVIEFGLNSIPLSLLFLLGGALCLISGFLYFPVFLLFGILFFVLLLRGVFDAVTKERKTLVFHLTVTLFSLLGFLLGAAAFALLLLYVLASLVTGTVERFHEYRDAICSFLENLGNRFAGFLNRF